MQRLEFMSSLRAAVVAMFGQGGRKEEDEEQGLRDALLVPHDCSEDQGGEVSMLRLAVWCCRTCVNSSPQLHLFFWCIGFRPADRRPFCSQ